ncbi:MAG: hypothetical protein M5T52_21045 [Ignavibacteriaceae bacterium]|nr:hypothetical protein [Ignavibacteriaceae bacterium]
MHIPHRDYVSKSVIKSGQGANQLMTGYYSDYRKGVHKAGSPTGHDAFRQVSSHPIQRTSDDIDFDNDDRVEYENPNDNIHSGWCMGINSTNYASAGCQVLVGYPQCQKRGSQTATGAWKIFKKMHTTFHKKVLVIFYSMDVKHLELYPQALKKFLPGYALVLKAIL